MLRRMAAPTAVVERDGAEQTIPATELVPGDVIAITAGDKVPADARLLEAHSLQVDESVLTGESLAVGKRADWIGDADTSLGDRENLLYSGTAVTFGRARAVVVATGMRTAFGQISGMLATLEDPEDAAAARASQAWQNAVADCARHRHRCRRARPAAQTSR